MDLYRRNFIAAVSSIGAVLLSRWESLVAVAAPTDSPIQGAALATLCSNLRCPELVGSACLRALPASEVSPENLSELILMNAPWRGKDYVSANALRQFVSDQSREDFRNGKVIVVDGWVLSLIETRVYALAALTAARHDSG